MLYSQHLNNASPIGLLQRMIGFGDRERGREIGCLGLLYREGTGIERVRKSVALERRKQNVIEGERGGSGLQEGFAYRQIYEWSRPGPGENWKL